MDMQLNYIFDIFGHEQKTSAPEVMLYYDFKPYNSEEPILFALGT